MGILSFPDSSENDKNNTIAAISLILPWVTRARYSVISEVTSVLVEWDTASKRSLCFGVMTASIGPPPEAITYLEG